MERYVLNPFPDYDNTQQLLSENGQLNDSLKEWFIPRILSAIRQWKSKLKFDPNDPSIYTGSAGFAILHLKMFEENLGEKLGMPNKTLLEESDSVISNECLGELKKHRFSFLCGSLGILALKCLICSKLGHNYVDYLKEIAAISEKANKSDIPNEVLFGRAGILYSLLFVRSKLPSSSEIIHDKLISEVVSSMLNSGIESSRRENSTIPLTFYWHEKAYVGAAHGYAGILYLLLEARRYFSAEQLNSLVKPTIDFVCSLQFTQTGNFPSSLSNPDDKLVHWCHGSPGVIHLLVLAYRVFRDEKYLNSALRAGENVWSRGLIKKGFGICHGVAGNGYALLRLFQLTHDSKHLYRAIKFAEWCCETGKQYVTRIPDRPESLFEGSAGTIYYLIDILAPQNAKFPAFQI